MSSAGIVHNLDRPIIDYISSLVYYDNHFWIAGGTVLNWYQGKPCDSDIDLFFRGKRVYEKLNDRLSKLYDDSHTASFNYQPPSSTPNWIVSERHTTDNAVTYTMAKRLAGHTSSQNYKVQLIKREFYETPEAILDDFDITVCQIATDGQRIWTSDHFAQDVSHKRVRFNKLTAGSAKRLVKYWVYGYEPTELELNTIFATTTLNWSAGDDDYT